MKSPTPTLNPAAVRSVTFTIMAVIIIALTFGYCGARKDADKLAGYISTVDSFKSKRLADSSMLSTQEQVIMTQKQAIAAGLLELDKELGKIKDVQAQIKFTSNTTVRPQKATSLTSNTGGEAHIEYIAVPQPCDTNSTPIPRQFVLVDTNKVVPIPTHFTQEDSPWYKVQGVVTRKDGRPVVDSIAFSMHNRYKITIADQKLSFFGKAKPKVFLKSDNPYSTTDSMRNVIIPVKTPFYKRPVFWTIVGAAIPTVLSMLRH